jgi:phosphonatase-like hydrolase
VQPALVVFDMAGTTIAASDGIGVALLDAFRSAGLEPPPEALRRVRGRRKLDAIVELIRGVAPGAVRPALATEIHAAFRDRLEAHYAKHPVTPIPGAEKTFRWLHARGIRMALTTGLDRDLAHALLRRLEWGSPLVSAVVCAEDVRNGRPAPDMIWRAMELAKVVRPAEVAVVGDTVVDLRAARNAGAGYAIGVLSGAADAAALAAEPHTVILDSVADLPGWWERYSETPAP